MMNMEWIEYNYAQMYRRIFLATADYESTDTQVTVDGVLVRKLFVSNLAQRSTFKDLQKCFSTYGDIESCYLRRNKKSNYAFVTFFKVEDAKQALEDGICKQVSLHNRDLKVLPADSWHQPDSIEKKVHKIKSSPKIYQKMESSPEKYQKMELSPETPNSLPESLSLSPKSLSLSSETESLSDTESSSSEAPSSIDFQMEDANRKADALANIFPWLSFKHRLNMERVCKAWQIAGCQREAWTDLKQLSLTSKKWEGVNIHLLRTALFRRVLQRGGRFLKELDLSYEFHCLGLSTVSVIAKFCHGLESLDLSGLTVSTSSLDMLAVKCVSLKKLTLGVTLTACDDELTNVINRTHLQDLTLKRTNIIGKCLLFLRPKEMSTLTVNRCEELLDAYFAKALNKLKLTKLVIRFCSRLQVKTIQAICDCTTLESLELDRNLFESDVDKSLLNNLPTKLVNLLQLTLIYVNGLETKFFKTLALSCSKLTTLNISGCKKVTIEGLEWLSHLKKLKKLYLNCVDNDLILNIPTLTHFECRKCQRVGDYGINEILKKSPLLQVLDVSGCNNVTDQILETANNICQNPIRNNSMLKIYVGGTHILRNYTLVNQSQLLEIVHVDLSNISEHIGDISTIQRNLPGQVIEEREEEIEEEMEEEMEEDEEESE